MHCIEGRFAHLRMPKNRAESEETDDEGGPLEGAVGFARFAVDAPEKYASVRPQPTTLVGYEFLVTAKLGTETLGTTKLLLTPGTIPPLRIRATPQVVKAGDTVEIEVLRGPDFQGDVPEIGTLSRAGQDDIEVKLAANRKAKLTVPADTQGWATVSIGGAVVRLFAQPKARLSVSVKPDKEAVRPGRRRPPRARDQGRNRRRPRRGRSVRRRQQPLAARRTADCRRAQPARAAGVGDACVCRHRCPGALDGPSAWSKRCRGHVAER